MLDDDIPLRMAWTFFFLVWFCECRMLHIESRFIYQVDNNTADRHRYIQKKIDEDDEALKTTATTTRFNMTS